VTEGPSPGLGVRRGAFHQLQVLAVEPVAEDAVAVSFSVPDHLKPAFSFQAGQHVTLRTWLDGSEVRRTYSICAPTGSALLQIGVRRLPGGVMSQFIHDLLRPGDALDVAEPAGHFTLPLDPYHGGSYVAVAAGSGITPVLSLIGSALATEVTSKAVLLYGNRTVESTMFLEEISDLKDRYPDRFQLVPLFSRERQEVELYNGRLSGPKVESLVTQFVDIARVDAWLLCGPHPMVTAVREVLTGRGVPESLIHTELFFVEDEPPVRSEEEQRAVDRGGGVTVRARLDGRETEFTMTSAQTIVDALAAVRPDAPYSCKGGVCATCRARLLEGKVLMDHTYALEADDQEAGYILTCQAHPVSELVTVDYDG